MNLSHHRLFRPLLVLLLLAGGLSATAQTVTAPDTKWGNVTKEELAQKSFAIDTSASAVVLFDVGESSMGSNRNLNFYRHRKVKILSTAGYDHASVSIKVITRNKYQKLSDLEAVTYTLGPDGTIVTTPIDQASVFEERVDERITRYRFTFPALQPGCIIEYQYRIVCKTLEYVPEWVFQEDIPSLWSELTVTVPKVIVFAVVECGHSPFAIKELKESKTQFRGTTASAFGYGSAPCFYYHYAMQNSPALKPEPYISSMVDYTQRIYFQLAETITPNGQIKMVLTTWKDALDDMLESYNGVKAIRTTGDVKKATQECTQGAATDEQKIQAIYRYLQTHIEWNGLYSAWGPPDVDDVLEKKRGDVADVNYLFLSMLKAADIEAYPVMFSTHAHGRVVMEYPMSEQFNYTAVGIRIDSTHYRILDATSPYRPIDLLPESILNTKGFVLREGNVEWAEASNSTITHRDLKLTASLGADGALTGKIRVQEDGYAALDDRKTLVETKTPDFVKTDLHADHFSLTIDSAAVFGKDSITAPMVYEANLTADNYAQSAGDLIYFTPFAVSEPKENPFTAPTRMYPVDFPYPHLQTMSIELTLPEGYELKSPMENRFARIGKSTIYIRKVQLQGRVLTVTDTLARTRTQFDADSYNALRDFYGKVIASHQEQIVLRKIAVAPPPAAAEPPKKSKGGKNKP